VKKGYSVSRPQPGCHKPNSTGNYLIISGHGEFG
jgi:hypothetical protein